MPNGKTPPSPQVNKKGRFTVVTTKRVPTRGNKMDRSTVNTDTHEPTRVNKKGRFTVITNKHEPTRVNKKGRFTVITTKSSQEDDTAFRNAICKIKAILKTVAC